jgi:hypothetical protein
LGAIVKKDLQAFPASFEVLPLIASAMDGIRDVQRACAEIALDAALAHSALLAGVLERIESTGSEGAPALFRHRRLSATNIELSPSVIPAEAVRILQSVACGVNYLPVARVVADRADWGQRHRPRTVHRAGVVA